MYRHILVPLDGSRSGSLALKHAREIALKFGSKVTLIRVVSHSKVAAAGLASPESMAAAEMVFEEAQREDAVNLAQAKAYLANHRRALERAGVKEAATYGELGDAGEIILAYAKKRKADLIVMTTRGRSGFARAFLGSVADELIRSAVAPVLVIKRSN